MLRFSGSLMLAAMALLMLCGAGSSQTSLSYSYPPVLINANEKIVRELRLLDRDLKAAADRLGRTALQGDGTRTVLERLCAGRTYVIDCAAVDPKGIMVTIEPSAYRKFEGADVSRQDQVIKLHNTKKPVLSQVFRSEEGIDAVDLEYPVFSVKKKFVGSASILFKPEELLRSVIEPLVRDLPTEIWVMQKDGRILYDVKKDEIGRMLFSDPMYKPFPELLKLGEKIVKEAQGHGFYDFTDPGTKQIVRKEAFWTTIGLHGTQWRLVTTRYVPKN